MRPHSAVAGRRRRRRVETRPSTSSGARRDATASTVHPNDRATVRSVRPQTSGRVSTVRAARMSQVWGQQLNNEGSHLDSSSGVGAQSSLSHPILDQLNSRLDLKNIDFILRTRGVRPTSAIRSMRSPWKNSATRRRKRPSTASSQPVFNTASTDSTIRHRFRRRPKSSHPVSAVSLSFANSANAYTWRFRPDASAATSSRGNAGDNVPRGSAREAGRWRRFQKLQNDVFSAQNARAAKRLEACHRAKANLWLAMDKFVDIMKRGAKTSAQRREQAHRMFVTLSSGFAGTEDPLITLPQMMSRICTFGYNWREVEPIIKRVFVAFDSDLDGLVDWRDIIVALRVAVRPLEAHDARLKLRRYSDEYNYMDRRTLCT